MSWTDKNKHKQTLTKKLKKVQKHKSLTVHLQVTAELKMKKNITQNAEKIALNMQEILQCHNCSLLLCRFKMRFLIAVSPAFPLQTLFSHVNFRVLKMKQKEAYHYDHHSEKRLSLF